MKIENVPYSVNDWGALAPTEHAGTTGTALWRTVEMGNLRVRVVELSPGYLADHWCARGHVVFVLEGEVVSELSDGSSSVLKPGMGYLVEDDVAPHRSFTETGAKMLIVD
jgi:quercetin dioxygenase-like cupin family protein